MMAGKTRTADRDLQRIPLTLRGVTVPLEVPYSVKNGYAIVALCVIVLAGPFAVLIFAVGRPMMETIYDLLGFYFAVPIEVPLALAVGLSIFLPVFFIYERRGRFAVDCVLWYLDQNDTESAANFAVAFADHFSRRDWKRSARFRQFVIENNLAQNSIVFQKYVGR